MSEMISVLFVNPADRARDTMSILASRLSSEYDVSVLLSKTANERTKPWESIRRVVFDDNYLPRIRYSLPTTSFLTQLWREAKRADIIHIFSYIYPTSSLGALVGSLLDKPVVVTVDAFPGISWSSGSRFVDVFGRFYTATVGRLTFRASNRVVGLGEYLRKELEAYTRDTSKIRIVPNGIDTQKYTSSTTKINSSENINEKGLIDLLYVGRVDPVKDVPTLLTAMSILDNSLKYNYSLTIVGDGAELEDCKAKSEELNISNKVTFEGWQDDVLPYYRSSDIFVLPSLSEGQPSVLMEAQACGLPAIATDVGAASDVIGAGTTTPPEDAESLAIAIERQAAKGEVGQVSTARNQILEEFSASGMISEYTDIYDNLLG